MKVSSVVPVAVASGHCPMTAGEGGPSQSVNSSQESREEPLLSHPELLADPDRTDDALRLRAISGIQLRVFLWTPRSD
jgi:hypothetical protein